MPYPSGVTVAPLIYRTPSGFVLDMRRAFEVVTVSDSVALGKKQYVRLIFVL